MNIRALIKEAVEEVVAPTHYRVNLSKKAIQQEMWDAQGEKQQFLGPNDKDEALFGNMKPELMDISGIANIADIQFMIERQGSYGRKVVDSLKKAMLKNKAIPPVTVWGEWNGKFNLCSGRHRVLASHELGMTHVYALKMYWREEGEVN
jgi:hypothetical protein